MASNTFILQSRNPRFIPSAARSSTSARRAKKKTQKRYNNMLHEQLNKSIHSNS
jgi:hypothetical protein